MRGAHQSWSEVTGFYRIIPADAGSTWSSLRKCRYEQDHPRGCGEHPLLLTVWDKFQGSSPRMRGARILSETAPPLAGIIPADAGSTLRIERAKQTPEDHPRGCGEHVLPVRSERLPDGSSPRMRGAPTRVTLRIPLTRIIPADAGSTLRGICL